MGRNESDRRARPDPGRSRLCPACSTPLEPDLERHQTCIPALEKLVIEREALAGSLDRLVLRLEQLEHERDTCRRGGDNAGAQRAGDAYDLLCNVARAEARALGSQFKR